MANASLVHGLPPEMNAQIAEGAWYMKSLSREGRTESTSHV